jgi:para-nitrobenzyl esterase
LTVRVLQSLGIDAADPGKLRRAPLEALLRAQAEHGGLSPVVDGRSLPLRPISAVREGIAREIPLLVGTTRDETRLFGTLPRSPIDDAQLEQQVRALLPRGAAERTGEVIAAYRASRAARPLPRKNSDIADAVVTASRFRIPATRLCEAQVAHQPQTFLYQLDWESPARHGELGACHDLEVPFVWGMVGKNGNTGFSGVGAEADRLAGQMMDAWLAFAKCGAPSHPGIGAWPAYGTATRDTMNFGRLCGASAAPFEEERAVWDSLFGLG